jgi:hypothetical protein
MEKIIVIYEQNYDIIEYIYVISEDKALEFNGKLPE